MSVASGMIAGMELSTVLIVVLAVLTGIGVGWLLAQFMRRSEAAAMQAQQAASEAALTQAHSDAEQARSELGILKVDYGRLREDVDRHRDEATRLRALAEDQRVVAAEQRVEAAEARQEAAEWQSRVAEHKARADAAEKAVEAANKRATQIAEDRAAMIDQFKVLSQETIERQGKQADATAEARLKATEQLMLPMSESLKEFRERLTQLDQERIRMSTELQGHVKSVQQAEQDIRRETQQLVTALRKPQVRGTWGEMQLHRVAETAGMLDRCDFVEQGSIRTDKGLLRPDMRVQLTDGRAIFVDSKVPLNAFLDANDAADEQQRAQHLASYARHVRTHVEQLGSKNYFDLSDAPSPQFVVMFLPGEGFLHSALDMMPDLYEMANKRGVVIATPSTLIAMLRTIAHVWQQATLSEQAAEILAEGKELYKRLGTMGEHLTSLGKSITGSLQAYNRTVRSLESRVLVSAKRLSALELSKPAALPTPLDEMVAVSPSAAIFELSAVEDFGSDLTELADTLADSSTPTEIAQ